MKNACTELGRDEGGGSISICILLEWSVYLRLTQPKYLSYSKPLYSISISFYSFISIYLSIYLYLYKYPFIHIFISFYMYTMYIWIYISNYVSNYLTLYSKLLYTKYKYLSFYLTTFLSIYLKQLWYWAKHSALDQYTRLFIKRYYTITHTF